MILVIGSINQDIVAKVNHLPKVGETILASSGEYFFGGKGANQAIACAKLGAECAFIGRVGADKFGQAYLNNFNQHNIDCQGVIVSKSSGTGLAFITVDEQAHNNIVVMQNANKEITINDVLAYEKLIDQCEFILLQLEIPLEAVKQIISLAYQKGKKIILNPAPCQKLNPELLSKLYVLTPNETEAYQIVNKALNTDTTNINNLVAVGQQILTQGVKNLIITIGSYGVLHFYQNEVYHYKGYLVNAEDTTGAGDTFNGALLYYLSQGYSFPEAITNAQAAAALCTLKLGAQTAMPTAQEVSEFVNKVGVSERMLIKR
ncbi:ribokinase [Clostridium sp. 'deep sea']|uniref:ribokinase n=1 Tax=Clostridium sp. 'deep sea' TaxID=2779445 RepID=UPI00189666E9|nr:ribokinase [Clostridium sp. 'deep sea']QOR35380.1 ribokinase [Clostridium sp. 'deep sea']